MMWITTEQKTKLRNLGGARWIRQMIDEAEEPIKLPWVSLHQRNLLIARDLRSAKLVAKDYKISKSQVERIRARIHALGFPVAQFNPRKKLPCPSSPPPSSSET